MKKTVFGILMLMFVGIIVSGCNSGPGEFDTFAQCLSEKNVKMYGTEWCSHCKSQKELFGNSFKYVDYIDCDRNREACQVAGIKGYPTWVIDGQSYSGEQPLERLASLSECELSGGK